MDKLRKISPATAVSNLSSDLTPKRSIFSQRPMTPLQMIQEKEKDKESRTPLRNPFDVKAEALYLPACSPSVFATFQKNKVPNGTFRWSVEHLSVLYPADIDETSVQSNWVDEEQEVQVQKAIDTFFSQNSIVPSPWSSSPKEGKGGIKSKRRVFSVFDDIQSSEASTQTMLSIPPNVDLSKILGNFFTYDDSEASSSNENSREECDMMSNSSLRRRLFVNDDLCASPCRNENSLGAIKNFSTPTVHMHSLQSTPASDVLSSSPITPPICSDSCNVLASPPVSPIASAGHDLGVQDESFHNNPENDSTSTPNKLYSPSMVSAAMNFSQDANIFPSYGSEKLDTGYATGSISSSQNITSDINFGLVSRITPVMEMMEECELSNSTCDMSYKNDCGSIGEISSFNLPKGVPPNFKTYPWLPTCCSTPTKCFHS